MDVREKLVEILRKTIFQHELVDPTEAVADYLLDSGVTVQEWISVKDMMPEAGGYVVCIAQKKSILQIYANGSKNREKRMGKSDN